MVSASSTGCDPNFTVITLSLIIMQQETMNLPLLCIAGFQQSVWRIKPCRCCLQETGPQGTDGEPEQTLRAGGMCTGGRLHRYGCFWNYRYRKVPDGAPVQDSSSTPTLPRGSHPVASWLVLRDSCALMSCSAEYRHTCPLVGQPALVPCHHT